MTFDEFTRAVHDQLAGTALSKGYNREGPDSDNALYQFVQDMVAGDGHPLGEIIYKARRYAARRDPIDMVKIAAWAFLVLKHRQE